MDMKLCSLIAVAFVLGFCWGLVVVMAIWCRESAKLSAENGEHCADQPVACDVCRGKLIKLAESKAEWFHRRYIETWEALERVRHQLDEVTRCANAPQSHWDRSNREMDELRRQLRLSESSGALSNATPLQSQTARVKNLPGAGKRQRVSIRYADTVNVGARTSTGRR